MSEITLQFANMHEAQPSGPGEDAAVSALETQLQFTAADQQYQNTLATQLDLRNSTEILRYGEKVQKRLRGFAEQTLQSAAACNLGAAGNLLVEMSNKIQNFSASSTKGGFLGLSRGKPNPEKLRRQYTEVAAELEQKRRELDGWRLRLLVEIDSLDKMYAQTVDYYKELEIYIRAGKQHLAAVQKWELTSLRQQADTLQTTEANLQLQDMEQRCESFAQRLRDLTLTKTICAQMMVQIQLSQQVNRELALRIQSSLTNAVAVWQQNIAVMLTAQYNQAILEANNQQVLNVIDATLELQRKGCEVCENDGYVPKLEL